jgi:hypothetical protein
MNAEKVRHVRCVATVCREGAAELRLRPVLHLSGGPGHLGRASHSAAHTASYYILTHAVKHEGSLFNYVLLYFPACHDSHDDLAISLFGALSCP